MPSCCLEEARSVSMPRTGVMRYLSEKGIGFSTSGGPVPIVPAAILYDLNVGDDPTVRPDAACGYEAARAARSGDIAEGSVGAGAGATIGKLLGRGRAMKGGIGSAAFRTASGLVVGAIVAVNAVGSVVDPRTGHVVAGVRSEDGSGLEDPFMLIRRAVRGRRLAREHDHRRGRHKRASDQVSGTEGGRNGPGWNRTSGRSSAHAIGR